MLKYDFKEMENPCFPLWDHGWCDITYCHVSGLEVDFIPTDVFASLLDHQIYKRYHCFPKRYESYTGEVHGPFLINQLKPIDFVEITAEELTEYLHARYADSKNFYGPPDPDQIEAIDSCLNQLPKEEARYFRLAEKFETEFLYDDYHHKRPELFHEWSHVFSFFDEYIILNPQQQAMWIVTLGYD